MNVVPISNRGKSFIGRGKESEWTRATETSIERSKVWLCRTSEASKQSIVRSETSFAGRT
jgi:hypothetical protein